jgi:hypothetical protein
MGDLSLQIVDVGSPSGPMNTAALVVKQEENQNERKTASSKIATLKNNRGQDQEQNRVRHPIGGN